MSGFFHLSYYATNEGVTIEQLFNNDRYGV